MGDGGAEFGALFDKAAGFVELAATQLAGFVGLLQDGAEFFVGIAGFGDFQCGGERDLAFLYAFDQAFFAAFEQEDDVIDVLGGETGLVGDGFRAVAALTQGFDVGEDFQGAVLAAGDVLRQAHDEGVFFADFDHQCRNMGFAEQLEGVQAPFPADQQILGFAISAFALGDGDGFLEADGLDVADAGRNRFGDEPVCGGF